MSLIIPHPGEAHLISGFILLKYNGEPIFTLSPSFTKSLGFTPLKSFGKTATIEYCAGWMMFLPGIPEIFKSCPFVIFM